MNNNSPHHLDSISDHGMRACIYSDNYRDMTRTLHAITCHDHHSTIHSSIHQLIDASIERLMYVMYVDESMRSPG
jgi:hypothetical protein